MSRVLIWATNLFPLWVLLGGGVALGRPDWFAWFRGDFITWGLAVVMLGMGVTLRVEDFGLVLRMPRAVALGVAAQFVVMPLLGWAVAQLFRLEAGLAVGLILVACCPGGTASNVVTYLARGNVALSVVLTMGSTLLAVGLTPLLTKGLAGAYVPVDAAGLFVSTVKIVLVPLALGVGLHHFAPRLVRVVAPGAPLVSVLVITLICASIIGGNVVALRSSGGMLLAAVVLLHLGGFVLGYGVARGFGFGGNEARTIAIEVGMQNSGLGAALAKQHFVALPLAAVPAAISATVHSLVGSLLAGWWRMRPAPGGAPRKTQVSSS
jgi:BASS family bile acid:Na+ symporter